MTPKQTDPTPLEAARSYAEDQRAALARWESENAAATVELESLRARVGEELVADPSAEERLAADLARLRDRIDLTARAAEALRSKIVEAERAVFVATAEEWDGVAARTRAAADVQEDKVNALLDQLEALEGLRYVAPPGGTTLAGLRIEVACAETSAWAAREVAEGRDAWKQLMYKSSDGGTLYLRRLEEYLPVEVRPAMAEPVVRLQATHVESLGI